MTNEKFKSACKQLRDFATQHEKAIASYERMTGIFYETIIAQHKHARKLSLDLLLRLQIEQHQR